MKNEDGEFELILGNRQLISVFFIVVSSARRCSSPWVTSWAAIRRPATAAESGRESRLSWQLHDICPCRQRRFRRDVLAQRLLAGHARDTSTQPARGYARTQEQPARRACRSRGPGRRRRKQSSSTEARGRAHGRRQRATGTRPVLASCRHRAARMRKSSQRRSAKKGFHDHAGARSEGRRLSAFWWVR